MANAIKAIKCVLISDLNVGKACLIYTYRDNKFPTEYYSHCIDEFEVEITVDEIPVKLSIHNSHDRREFHSLRPLVYPNADVIIICFSVITPESYENVREKCYPEVLRFCKNMPRILVGTKLDLRDDPTTLANLKAKNQLPITNEQGMELANEISAKAYLECSSFTGFGVKAVFENAARIALQSKMENKKPRKHCQIQ